MCIWSLQMLRTYGYAPNSIFIFCQNNRQSSPIIFFHALNAGTTLLLSLIGVENILYLRDFSSSFPAKHEIVSSWVNIKFHGRYIEEFQSSKFRIPDSFWKGSWAGYNPEFFTSRTRNNVVTQPILIVDIKRRYKEGHYCATLHIEDVIQRHKNDLFQAKRQ